MKKYELKIIILVFIMTVCLCACGMAKQEVSYEVIDGQIVEIRPDAVKPEPTKKPDSSKKTEKDEAGIPEIDNQLLTDAASNEEPANFAPGEEAYDGKDDVEGMAVTIVEGNKEYNTIAAESDIRIKALENDLEHAVNACGEIYSNADKGEGINITLSPSTVAEMITAIGNAGYSAIDSNNDFNMQGYLQMDEFGKSITREGNISGTFFVLYNDGHMSGYTLYRENNSWHLLAMSSQLEQFKVYQDSKGRYTVDEVRYTDKGWLIYKRNTDTTYNMIRVLPVDSYCRQLCQRYIEPVGYLENNLFTSNWDESNLGPIDFNSLYAYLFGMYNGTQMLSSYNVRNYYKAYGGTRIYIIPTDTFETVVNTYFSIDPGVLKSISDYSGSLGGYMFLGYNRDYYNVAPKTPLPEVIEYHSNNDGSVSMTVDAVSRWYGTDRAFRHVLTVYPEGNAFKYISNTLVEDENNILPERKLSEMLDVERSKSVY